VRRLARHIFNVMSALSLLLCLAMAGVWIRSHVRSDVIVAGYWHYTHHGNYVNYFDAWQVQFLNGDGQWAVRGERRACVAGPGPYEATPGAKGKLLDLDPANAQVVLRSANRDLWRDSRAKGFAGVRYFSQPLAWALSLRHSVCVGLLAILPLADLGLTLRGSRRVQIGMCVRCGYDLRATPHRCPECGMVPVNKSGNEYSVSTPSR
jgi:hypothetical protein